MISQPAPNDGSMPDASKNQNQNQGQSQDNIAFAMVGASVFAVPVIGCRVKVHVTSRPA
jgi:hypothetical protein